MSSRPHRTPCVFKRGPKTRTRYFMLSGSAHDLVRVVAALGANLTVTEVEAVGLPTLQLSIAHAKFGDCITAIGGPIPKGDDAADEASIIVDTLLCGVGCVVTAPAVYFTAWYTDARTDYEEGNGGAPVREPSQN